METPGIADYTKQTCTLGAGGNRTTTLYIGRHLNVKVLPDES